jgi:citrate lyase alpha subunit
VPVKDKEKKKEIAKRHYAKHTAKIKATTKSNKEKYRQKWRVYKATLSCIQCGEKDPATFDFHHVVRSPDNKKVNRLLTNGNYKGALKEIEERCIVLCANCHRKLHDAEYQAKKKKKEAEASSDYLVTSSSNS